jgi:hypothetical protein
LPRETEMQKSGWIKVAIAAAFLLSLLIAGLFAARTIRQARYWHHHRDEQIRPWMSIHYIARSYRVPPRVLFDAIGLKPGPPDRRPLREIAAEQNRPVSELISELQTAIVRERAEHPPHSQPSPQHLPSKGGMGP